MCVCVHVFVIWLVVCDMLCPYGWSSYSAFLLFPYGSVEENLLDSRSEKGKAQIGPLGV